MRNFALLIISCLLFYSCEKKSEIEKHLNNGLENLKNVRNINESFIEKYEIKKFGVLKQNDSSKVLIFKVNDDINEEIVNKYRVGVLLTLDKSNSKLEKLPENITKKSYDFSPKLEVHNRNRYIITKINTKIKRVDEMSLYIYIFDGKKITKLEKNKIHIKNFSLL